MAIITREYAAKVRAALKTIRKAGFQKELTICLEAHKINVLARERGITHYSELEEQHRG